jgi:5'/3'-nucleotidase
VNPKRILITNDDGVKSPGVFELARALSRLGEVTIVAPHLEASAIGHALTLRRPLRVEQVGANVYEVDGTPTDCVNIAFTRILDTPPDVILSGINKGYNLGDDVTYSGTVAGAMEGALLGIPSIAVSLERSPGPYDFRHAALTAAQVAERLLAGPALPARTFLNVNVPSGKPKGIRITVQAKRNHVTVVDQRVDPRGQAYYWIEEGQNDWEPHDRSDYQAVRDGFVSVTPLQPDLTDYNSLAMLDELSTWREVEVE